MTPRHSAPHPAPDREARATAALETFDAWAQVLRQAPQPPRRATQGPDIPDDTAPRVTPPDMPLPPRPAVPPPLAPPPVPAGETPLTRPVHRPPLALVHVVDDGRDGGETVRMRAARLVIGRDAGDITVPHDILMATPHATLERLPAGGWQLSDAGSAGGTFVRVMQARLRVGSEVIVGGTRLQVRSLGPTGAQLVERTPATDAAGLRWDDRRSHTLSADRATLGRRGHGCTVEIDDPFVSPMHAECLLTSRGWQVRNRGSNGLWVRIDAAVTLSEPSQFLCGEQRFVFEPLR